MNGYGFVRVSSASVRTVVAHPDANVAETLRVLATLRDSDIVLFPELGVTGYTAADLFGQEALLAAARRGLGASPRPQWGVRSLSWSGCRWRCRAAFTTVRPSATTARCGGSCPSSSSPSTRNSTRPAGSAPPREASRPRSCSARQRVPFGTDLLFEGPEGVTVGVEICEDLWMPVPPSSLQALAGATILLNLSASNETIGKSAYRTELVVGQSGRCIAAYAYAGAGPSESTTDLVFAGHCLIAENGQLLTESRRVGDGGPLPRESDAITADVDVSKLLCDRRATTSFAADARHHRTFRRIPFSLAGTMPGLKRFVPGAPFVPAENAELHRRCAEIFGIQCAGLVKRIEQLPGGASLNIGISGGLDSTLALLVAVKTCDLIGRDRRSIRGLTMPGFGTTQRTFQNALALMEHLGVTAATIDICELTLKTFQEMDHAPFGLDCRDLDVPAFKAALATVPKANRCDLVFENVQARLRTFLLMSHGFVVGTGDLSELALGWCTYNGDHMSMYNPNCSIPKTLVKFLVRYVAEHEFGPGPVRETLLLDRGHDDLSRAAPLLDQRRDRAGDRGDARGLRAARLLLVPHGPLRLSRRTRSCS